MKRILFAWELGENWGHLARDLPIALALRERGYDVRFAVRDLQTAAHFLAPHQFPFEQAPVPATRAPRRVAAENYAGVLSSQGYANPDTLRPLLEGWLEVFRTTAPTVMVADFAPGAMLAARVAGLAQAAVGLGFELPPPVHPLPPIQPWRLPPRAGAVAENALLDCVNSVLMGLAAPQLHQLCDLFAGKWTALTTFPELDHYGPRTGGHYVGPIYSAPKDAQPVRWPENRGPRLLAYLHPKTRGLEATLVASSTVGTLIACVPGLATPPAPGFRSCLIHPEALQLQQLLPDADLMLTNGSLTTSTQALLAGVPVLALPNSIEQHLGCLRITGLGAGLIAAGDRSERSLNALLRALLRPPFRDNARGFAQRHANERVDRAVDRAADLIEAAV